MRPIVATSRRSCVPRPRSRSCFRSRSAPSTSRWIGSQRLEAELLERRPAWRLYPVVQALQALRGVQWLVAITVVAELGDLTRFDSSPPARRIRRTDSVGVFKRPRAAGSGDHQNRATVAPGAPSSKAPGRIAIRRKCPSTCNAASTRCRSRFRTSAGRRKCGCANAFDDSSRAGNIRTWRSPRSRANSSRSCGRLRRRSRSRPNASSTKSRVGVGVRPGFPRSPRRR